VAVQAGVLEKQIHEEVALAHLEGHLPADVREPSAQLQKNG
jgi:hypothetical protein